MNKSVSIKISKKAIALLIILLASTLTASLSFFTASAAATTALHTDGQYIKDTSGNTVTLRGVDKGLFLVDATGGFSWVGNWDATAMRADVDRMVSLKINCVRVLVNMDWWYTDPVMTWNGPIANQHYRYCLDQYITYAQSKGLYIFIEPWQIKGATGASGSGQSGTETPNQPWGVAPISTSGDFVAWWLSVATATKQYSNVIYGLWNEPHGDSATFLNAAKQAVAAIRTQTNAIVFVQNGYAGSMDFAPSYMAALSVYGNIGISNHIYRGGAATFQDMSVLTQAQIVSYLNSKWQYSSAVGKYPIMIGELGAYIGQSNEQTWHQNMLSVLNSWGASYTCWIWDQNYGGAYGLLNGQAGSLTWGGQDLVNALQSTSTSPQTPIATPTATPSPTPSPTARPTVSPTPTKAPTPTTIPPPLPTATATLTPSPTPKPTAPPTPTPQPAFDGWWFSALTPTPDPTTAPTPTALPTPTPQPVFDGWWYSGFNWGDFNNWFFYFS